MTPPSTPFARKGVGVNVEREAEAALLRSGVKPTHRCGMCGHEGFEDGVVGCLRCGWDEMQRIETEQTRSGDASGSAKGGK